MLIRSLLKLNKGFKIPLGSLKANFVQASQNFIKFSVSARARFLHFDPVKSSVDATEVSQCVFPDATKLPPLKCLKNPVNTQLSVKRAWDISLLKYIHRYYRFFTPNNAILSHLFLERSASLSVRVTIDA